MQIIIINRKNEELVNNNYFTKLFNLFFSRVDKQKKFDEYKKITVKKSLEIPFHQQLGILSSIDSSKKREDIYLPND